MKNSIITVLVLIVLGFGAYFLIQSLPDDADVADQDETAIAIQSQNGDNASTTENGVQDESKTIIGKSVEGREIVAYHYNHVGEMSDASDESSEILFVGGIHGGYSWNTSLVAYEAMDYLEENPDVVTEGVKVTIIPVLNPDGLYKVVGTDARFSASDVSESEDVQESGRFNFNDVDLNRNFDCDWQAEGKWQNKTVSGGGEAFSEPESLAIKNYIETQNPSAVVVWYSAAGGVFASNCHNGVLEETKTLTNTYAEASGYRAYNTFNFYEITGDMTNWLAKEGVPAISVLLSNHKDIEWSKNKAGIEALIKHYTK